VTTTTFAVVGSGWRSMFFLRLARVLPERLRAVGVVTRTAQRAAQLTAEQSVRAFLSIDDMLAAERPDYVIVSTDWPSTPGVTRDLVARGVRVLAETPPAPDLDGLRALWTDVGASGLVQVAEQYLLMPGHAARREVLRAGTIGAVGSVQISSTHLYHATSLFRGLLGVGFEPALVDARAFVAPLANPLRGGQWTGDDTPEPTRTTLATLDFGAGRSALYDFTDNQWWNPLRERRIVIRGSRGEIVDDEVVRLIDATTPVRSALQRRETAATSTSRAATCTTSVSTARSSTGIPMSGPGCPRTTSRWRRSPRRRARGHAARVLSRTRWRTPARTTSSASRSRSR